MSSTAQIKTITAALMAMLIVMGSVGVVLGNQSDGTYAADYGEVYEINLAPGFSYTYSPSYPSDLDVTTSIEKYENTGIDANVDNGVLKVTVKNGVSSGSYDIILKAQTNTGGLSQTAYQHIRINVVSGLSVSGSINDIVKGAAINFTPTGSSDMGTVTWKVKDGTQLPAGLTLSNGKVTGTPTTVGPQKVSLTATAKGETKDLEVTFTVYNAIVGGSDEVIYSNGNTVSSTPISQTGTDLGVTWSVTSGTIPVGFTLNNTTGVISGSSTELKSTQITITGTASNGPAQSITKKITIQTEPSISVDSPGTAIITYPGAAEKTMQMSATAGTSKVTWSVSSAAGVVSTNRAT